MEIDKRGLFFYYSTIVDNGLMLTIKLKGGNKMKKIFLILTCGLFTLLLFSSCDQQKALDNMLSKPELAETILTRMWDKPEMKAKIQEMMLQDQESRNKTLDAMLQDSTAWGSLTDKISSNEGFKTYVIAKAKDWEKAAKAKKK